DRGGAQPQADAGKTCRNTAESTARHVVVLLMRRQCRGNSLRGACIARFGSGASDGMAVMNGRRVLAGGERRPPIRLRVPLVTANAPAITPRATTADACASLRRQMRPRTGAPPMRRDGDAPVDSVRGMDKFCTRRGHVRSRT